MEAVNSSFLSCAILVLCFVLKASGNAEAFGNAEVDALSDLRNNLRDPKNVLQNWDPNLTDPCDWSYVSCNNRSVTRLDLGSLDLSGQMVPQLGQLSNLEYFAFGSNNINGTIPDELGNLKNLVSLDLSSNSLTGRIPNTLGKLAKLTFLSLNDNELTGEIPMSLTNLLSLKELNLSSNHLTGKIPMNGSFAQFKPISFQNNPSLIYPKNKVNSGSSVGLKVNGIGFFYFFLLLNLITHSGFFI